MSQIDRISPIHKAVQRNDARKVAQLVKQDSQCVREPFCESVPDLPLHEAARQGEMKIAQILIDAGADVNASGDWARTPLHYAAGHGHLKMARFLLEAGADPNAKNSFGWTPLLTAVRGRDPGCMDIGRFLLNNGCKADLNSLVSLGEISRVRDWLKDNPDAIKQAIAPDDLIDDAVIMIGLKIMEEVGYNASLEEQEKIIANYQEIISYLQAAGADINALGSSGIPPLFTAISSGEPALVLFLLQHGANANQRVLLGNGISEDAFYYNHGEQPQEIRNLLVQHGFKR